MDDLLIEDEAFDEQMLMQLIDEDEIEEEDAHMSALLAFVLLLHHGAEESRRAQAACRNPHRTYLTHPELLPNPRANTPWQRLYSSQSDQAFITTMGFDVATFNLLLWGGFAERWDLQAIPCDGWSPASLPRLQHQSLDAAGALGLVLHWLTSTMRKVSLMQIFALIPTTVSRYINFTHKILTDTLQNLHDAQVVWPRGEEFEENNNLVMQRHHLLDGAFGSLDGLKLPVQSSPDQEIENATYNGWLHEHFITCVLAFSVKGTYQSASSLIRLILIHR
jgi:hypothetical protein